MKITTKHEIVTLTGHANHAQLVVQVFINERPAGSMVVMSGPKDAIEDFVSGKIDQDELQRRFDKDWGNKDVKARKVVSAR